MIKYISVFSVFFICQYLIKTKQQSNYNVISWFQFWGPETVFFFFNKEKRKKTLTGPIVFKAVEEMEDHHEQRVERNECNVHLSKENKWGKLPHTLTTKSPKQSGVRGRKPSHLHLSWFNTLKWISWIREVKKQCHTDTKYPVQSVTSTLASSVVTLSLPTNDWLCFSVYMCIRS